MCENRTFYNTCHCLAALIKQMQFSMASAIELDGCATLLIPKDHQIEYEYPDGTHLTAIKCNGDDNCLFHWIPICLTG